MTQMDHAGNQENSNSRTARRLHRTWRRGMCAAIAFFLFRELRLGAEDHADYKYEVYAEEAGRVLVRTHSVLAEAKLTSWLGLKGQYVYDGISGATPTGHPPPPGAIRCR